MYDFFGWHASRGGTHLENGYGNVWPLRVVEWVALIRFLFGMCHY